MHDYLVLFSSFLSLQVYVEFGEDFSSKLPLHFFCEKYRIKKTGSSAKLAYHISQSHLKVLTNEGSYGIKVLANAQLLNVMDSLVKIENASWVQFVTALHGPFQLATPTPPF